MSCFDFIVVSIVILKFHILSLISALKGQPNYLIIYSCQKIILKVFGDLYFVIWNLFTYLDSRFLFKNRLNILSDLCAFSASFAVIKDLRLKSQESRFGD